MDLIENHLETKRLLECEIFKQCWRTIDIRKVHFRITCISLSLLWYRLKRKIWSNSCLSESCLSCDPREVLRTIRIAFLSTYSWVVPSITKLSLNHWSQRDCRHFFFNRCPLLLFTCVFFFLFVFLWILILFATPTTAGTTTRKKGEYCTQTTFLNQERNHSNRSLTQKQIKINLA